MFQNDINFVFSNLDLPVSDKEASEFLKAEIMRHEGDSVSGPYYLTKDTVEKELPNFSFVIDSMRWPREGQARIVIYNAYQQADRSFDPSAENVEFEVMPLYGELKAIIGCFVDEEFDDSLIELQSASGESPIMIAIQHGDQVREFPVCAMDEAAGHLSSLR